ncbi:LysM peptidoglycan-binding domain-containing protein [Thiomonas sp.]|uniref:LysM peptidoglycan-binding domain-containing protein n=1 Tax=Thiomonas sp. TaxID=2047785 RepID=UPI0026197B29|nr:LysM domain-containing protein [Thiomonas sp.]
MQRKLYGRAGALGLLFWLGLAAAQAAGSEAPPLNGLPDYPVSTQQRERADAAAHAGVPVDELAAGAPQRYEVRKGDTLWRISGMYLKKPWNWPDLWGMNLERIRNPHWIFPGQVLVLTIVNGRAMLTLEGEGTIPTLRVEPGVQYKSLPPAGIPTIDPELIGPFLTRPLLVEPKTLAMSPRIVALSPGHVMLAPHEVAYVRGDVGTTTRFDVYRPARELRNPHTHKVIAYESDYIGTVQVVHGPQGKDAVSTVRATTMAREMVVGDLLIAQPPRQYLDFTPHAPKEPVHADIISIHDDMQMAGKNSVVAIDAGAAEGLDRGTVLAIQKAPREVEDTTVKGDPKIEIPARRVGLLMVFRTFRHVSFGLVLSADTEIEVPDRVLQP